MSVRASIPCPATREACRTRTERHRRARAALNTVPLSASRWPRSGVALLARAPSGGEQAPDGRPVTGGSTPSLPRRPFGSAPARS